MKLAFIAQPYHSMQCGQACLAMITQSSLLEVIQETGKHWSTHIKNDLQKFLDKRGYTTALVEKMDVDFQEIPNNSIVRICYPNETGHFVVKADNVFYDPSVGIVQTYQCYVKITHYLTYAKNKKNHPK
ncbi:hypothetical protein [Tenacibaculum sp. 190130A14a]|uniref:Peptidase C39 domain-containing protein n=1 Tax=Tenacibaculum polynesiense TaxID=3137857 RepID=A0ABM9PGA5_9FLAO